MAVLWSSATALTTQTAIDNSTEEFMGTIDLLTSLQAHVQLEIDNEHSTTVTDDVIISVYATVDVGGNFDDVPFMSFSVTPAAVALERMSFIVSGVTKFRIGALSTGATDTYAVGGDYKLRTT